jgi:tetratricopeptide (TPR) repeat protein
MGVPAAILWLGAPAHEDLELQIARLSEQIRREPERAVLYFRRGELRRMHEEWTAAREDLERAAALDPDLAVADLSLGRLWSQAGDPRRARAALDRFLKRSPEHGEALLERARARAALGDRDGALDDYGRGIPAPGAAASGELHRARRAAARGEAARRGGGGGGGCGLTGHEVLLALLLLRRRSP